MELLKNQKRILDVIKDNGPIKKEEIARITNLAQHKVNTIISEFYDGEIINKDVNGMISINTKQYAFRNENSAHEVNHWREYKLKNLSRIV